MLSQTSLYHAFLWCLNLQNWPSSNTRRITQIWSENNINLTWQKTTKYNQYQWTELNTFSKISGKMQINGKPGNKQNSTCTTVINSALHYYNCRMDNIPLYLEPTNKTAT